VPQSQLRQHANAVVWSSNAGTPGSPHSIRYVYDEVLSSSNHPEECDVSTYYLDYHVSAELIRSV
jgi:hypothetical protein